MSGCGQPSELSGQLRTVAVSLAVLVGVHSGLGSKMGVDATSKWPGETSREWGRPIVMDAAVRRRVDSIWTELGL